jgi:ATP-dependent Clp protease ATP-binding subunit ClpA
MFERFTDRARRIVVLAQEEARRLDHNYIGTEHILLGLIREGDGVAAQVLVRRGADLNRVRQEVIQLLATPPDEEPGPGAKARLEMVEQRLAAMEQEVGRLRSLLEQHGIDPQDTPA